MIAQVALITGFALMLIGLWAIVTNRNLIRIIVGFSVFDTGTHILIVSLGYLRNRTAPILDAAVDKSRAAAAVVDPVPQALVLTAIVIGLGVTALMLTFAVRMYQQRKSLQIDSFKELKW